MPKVTVYVRKEDYPKWKAIEEKTEFIHKSLSNFEIAYRPTPKVNLLRQVKYFNKPTLQIPVGLDPTKEPHEALNEIVEKLDFKLCKHGADPKLCKFAKPGKPCK